MDLLDYLHTTFLNFSTLPVSRQGFMVSFPPFNGRFKPTPEAIHASHKPQSPNTNVELQFVCDKITWSKVLDPHSLKNKIK